jgi:hypothetical protein
MIVSKPRNAFAVLLVASITAAGALLAPATASADSYTGAVCHDPSFTVGELGFVSQGNGPFQLLASCPDLTMQMVAEAGKGDRMGYALALTNGIALTRITATLSGGPAPGSGIEFRLLVCSYDECGRPLVPDSSGLPTPGELTPGDGIPDNPVTLLIEQQCTLDGICAIQPETLIADLELTHEHTDTVAPEVDLRDAWGVPYSSTTPTMIEPLDYVYTDPGDAVEMWWTIDDGPETNTICSDLPEDPVPTNCGFMGMIRPPDFEGVVKLTVFLKDAAGNVGSDTALLNHDTTPPGAPEELSVEDGDGYVNNWEFDAFWENPGDGEGADSDVAGARFEIRKTNGDLVRSGTVTLVDAEALHTWVGFSGMYTLTVWLRDAVGNEGPGASTNFYYDWIPPIAPLIDPIPVVNANFVSTGFTITWADSTYWDITFTGICTYRTAINSLPEYIPTTWPGMTAIPFPTQSIVISPEKLAQLDDGALYVHVAGTSCAGVNGPTSHAKIVIDRQPPTIRSAPATGGWLAPNKPLVIRADDADPDNPYAGVAKIIYSVDGGPEQTVSGTRAEILLPQGGHTIVSTAEDFAGNRTAPLTTVAGVDEQAPTGAFDAVNPADPALVSARVSDSGAGVADAWLEYRQPGSPIWARLPGSSEGESPRVLTARFPDDDSLPSGEYQLQIVARDRAGNRGTTTTRVDGRTAVLTLPLRKRAALTLAVSRNAKSPDSNSLTVPFGSSVIARGSLHDADGTPIANVPVAISESVSGGQRKQIAVATTDGAGSYAAAIQPGPSRVLTADFRGDTYRGSATANATFNVRARITLRKLSKTVRSGQRFYLRGKVDPGLAALPKAGARVMIQHRSGRGWSGLVRTTRTASDGSFEISWRQRTGGRKLQMTFRAAVETESGWPYATGYSAVRRVVIR